jgi:hypothetical protein
MKNSSRLNQVRLALLLAFAAFASQSHAFPTATYGIAVLLFCSPRLRQLIQHPQDAPSCNHRSVFSPDG